MAHTPVADDRRIKAPRGEKEDHAAVDMVTPVGVLRSLS